MMDPLLEIKILMQLNCWFTKQNYLSADWSILSDLVGDGERSLEDVETLLCSGDLLCISGDLLCVSGELLLLSGELLLLSGDLLPLSRDLLLSGDLLFLSGDLLFPSNDSLFLSGDLFFLSSDFLFLSGDLDACFDLDLLRLEDFLFGDLLLERDFDLRLKKQKNYTLK